MASFSPWKAWVVAAEKTEAMTMGVKTRIEKSRRRISRTKKTPAIGALKIDAMPAAAHERADVFAGDAETTAQERAEGGADLDDGPLGAGRAPAAHGGDGGEGLDETDAEGDLAVALDEGLEDLGHAVALGLAREPPDKHRADEGPHHRDGRE